MSRIPRTAFSLSTKQKVTVRIDGQTLRSKDDHTYLCVTLDKRTPKSDLLPSWRGNLTWEADRSVYEYGMTARD